ncbi:MAG: hypothetical protein K9H62_12445 [Bacteroidales bacterium]|nr:hypothetical protein [Bacteroidales bacterium]
MIRLKSYTTITAQVYSPLANITGYPTTLPFQTDLDINISLIATKNTYDIASIILYRYISGAWVDVTGNVVSGGETQTYLYHFVENDIIVDVKFKLVVLDIEGNSATAYATIDSLPKPQTWDTLYMGYRIDSQGPVINENIIKGVVAPNQQVELDPEANHVSYPAIVDVPWKNESSFGLDPFGLYYMWFAISEADANQFLYQQNMDELSDKGSIVDILVGGTYQSLTIDGENYRLYIREKYAPQNLRFGYTAF